MASSEDHQREQDQQSLNDDSKRAVDGVTNDASEPDLVEQVAEEFLQRYRKGERPAIEEFTQRYPDLQEDLRELLPTIAAMERIKVAKADRAPAKSLTRLGDFRIVGEIGRGGMGIVYEAIQESLDREVAVKVLPQSSLIDERRLKRFEREARTAAKLHHTNIVPVLGVGDHEGVHYYVMQYIRGVGLDEVISAIGVKNHDSSSSSTTPSGRNSFASDVAQALLKGQFLLADSSHDVTTNSQQPTRLDMDETVDIFAADSLALNDEAEMAMGVTDSMSTQRFSTKYWRSIANTGRQVADALHYAHTMGVLHRDVKPANLLLDRTGVVWVADFGLAKAIEHDNVSRTGDIVGTLRYMAPEQLREKADSRSDIFSLGVTLYELVTLRQAFRDSERKQAFLSQSHELVPTSPRKFNPRIPRDLETIILKAMAMDPEERYQDAGQLAEDLQRFIDDRPITARRIPLAERAWRWCRRNPAIAGLSTTACLLLFVAAGSLSVAYFQASDAAEREAELRAQTEETLNVTLNGLEQVYRHFAPDRVVDPPSLTYSSEDRESLEVQVEPALDEQSVAVLMKVLSVYDGLGEKNSGNERLSESEADATRRVGDIQRRLGNREEAAASYEKATKQYRQLSEAAKSRNDDQSSQRYQLEFARICYKLAVLHSGDPDLSDEHVHRAIGLLTNLARDPKFTAAKFELARTYYLSHLLGQEPDIRLQSFQWSDWMQLELDKRVERLIGPEPTSGRRSPRLGRRGFWARMDDAGQGRNASNKYLNDAIQLLDDMHATGNASDDSQFLRALCLGGLAGEHHEEVVKILRNLVGKHPENTEFVSAFAKHQLRQARALEYHFFSSDDRSEARASEVERAYRGAVAAQRQVILLFPQVIANQLWSLEMEISLARWFVELDQPEQAIVVFNDAISGVIRTEEFTRENRPLVDYLAQIFLELSWTYAMTDNHIAEQFTWNIATQLAMPGFPGRAPAGLIPNRRGPPLDGRGPGGGRGFEGPGSRNRPPAGRRPR
ncbi:MAG TPA: serine/threonine protein kinase [Planctomycetes bacterium]|nr:serine/threonine protein kinase [Planctomycetota bacterium]